jgi:hypothetical protein
LNRRSEYTQKRAGSKANNDHGFLLREGSVV